MKLSDLKSSSIADVQLTHPVTEEPIDVIITGYTPDSAEWRKLSKKYIPIKHKQEVIIGKKRNSVEMDSIKPEVRLKLLAETVTNIKGLDNWVYSPEKVVELFTDPEYQWMADQYAEFMDDRKNFFDKPANLAKPGSVASPG